MENPTYLPLSLIIKIPQGDSPKGELPIGKLPWLYFIIKANHYLIDRYSSLHSFMKNIAYNSTYHVCPGLTNIFQSRYQSAQQFNGDDAVKTYADAISYVLPEDIENQVNISI